MLFRFGPDIIRVNTPSADGLLAEVEVRLKAGTGFTLATINLDHLVKLTADPAFRAVYSAHDLVVADGHPIVWLSLLAGRPVKLAPGSDLVLELAGIAARCAAPVALLGSTPPTLRRAARRMQAACPGLQVTARLAPAHGFDPTGPEADALLDRIGESGARLCFVALGAPKQETFAAHARKRLPDVAFISVGAGLDFLAGTQMRAPRFMRRMAMEWLWRMGSAPRRMIPRYALCAAILPRQVWQAIELRGKAPDIRP